MEKNTDLSRRNVLAGGLGVVLGGLLTIDAEAAEGEKPARRERRPRPGKNGEGVWKYVKLDSAQAAQAAYDAYDPNGCMYGAVKGALTVYADTIEATDPELAAAARNFPCIAFRSGKTGLGSMESLCGTINGASFFMGLFVPDLAELHTLIKMLGEYYSETPMPGFVPAEDKHPNFPQSVSHSLLCVDNKGIWLALDESPEHHKLRSERCKRTTATLIAHAIEMLNQYFEVGLEGMQTEGEGNVK